MAERRHRLASSLPSSLPPRGLSREQAAAYVGVSARMFDFLVQSKDMPEPRRLRGRVVWDRHELDAAFDRLPYRHGHAGPEDVADDVWGSCAL